MGDVSVKYYDVGGIVIKHEVGERIHDHCFEWDGKIDCLAGTSGIIEISAVE